MKIRIGHLSTFYHTAIFLIAKGEVDKRMNAPVEWTLFGNGPAIMQAFKQGKLDLAYIGLPPAIIGIDQNIPVICIAGGHMEGTVLSGKTQWSGFPETKDLGSVLAQFRGRRIGVPGKGSIHDVILNDSIEHYGLGREIEIVNYAWSDMVTEALARDEVAGAMGTPALAIAVNRFAQGRILYPPEKLWPENPSYGIVAHRHFLASHPKIVELFLELHEEATEFIRHHPREASGLIADYVRVIDEQFVLDTLAVSPKYCALLTDAYIASAMKFVPVLRRLGYITSNIPRDRIFYRDLIDRVHPGKDHYGAGIRE